MITCALCGDEFSAWHIEEHLVEVHGQEPIKTWPDGTPVIIDATLTPDDFGEAKPARPVLPRWVGASTFAAAAWAAVLIFWRRFPAEFRRAGGHG